MFVGIAVANAELVESVLRGLERFTVTNDERAVRTLVERLRPLALPLIVLEATGGSELRGVAALAAAVMPVVVGNPRQVRHSAKATGQLAKADRLDADILARFADVVRPAVRPVRRCRRPGTRCALHAAARWQDLRLRPDNDRARRHDGRRQARSLEEGLEETLTLHRLGVVAELGTSFKTTNLIESVMARVEAKTPRVDRWRTSDQKLRWCAATLMQIE